MWFPHFRNLYVIIWCKFIDIFFHTRFKFQFQFKFLDKNWFIKLTISHVKDKIRSA